MKPIKGGISATGGAEIFWHERGGCEEFQVSSAEEAERLEMAGGPDSLGTTGATSQGKTLQESPAASRNNMKGSPSKINLLH